MLRRLGADAVEVRKPEQLDGLDGLVIPGGESTTFMRLMRLYGLDEAIRGFDRPGLRHLRRDDRARPRPSRPRRRRGTPERVRPAGRVVRDRPRRRRASRRRCAPSSSARRGSTTSVPSVEVLAEVDGRPVLAREGRFLVAAFHPELTDDTRLHELFLELGQGGAGCPGIASGRRSSTRRARPTRSAASSSRSSRAAIIVAAKEGGGDPANNLVAAERDREGEVVLDAEGQHRPCDREGLRRRRRRGRVRDDRLRGLRPGGRRRDRRGADRQPEPHGRRRAPHVREARRQPRRDRRRRVAVRASRRRRRRRDGVDEEELLLVAADGGAEDVEQDGAVFQVTSTPEQLSAVRHGDRGGRA